MSSQRLRSTLYHSVPKPVSRPAPLWQAAASLDPAARVQEEPASYPPLPAPTLEESPATHQPRTSAILAGWVCVGCGLLIAWIFPPANLFFSIGIVLSVVALATHQIRDGLLLLAGSLAGIGISVLLFMFGFAALLFHAVPKLPEIKPPPTPNPTTLRYATPPPVAQAPVIPVSTPRPVPLTLAEVSAMISAGRGDDEIIRAVFDRPLLGRLGVAETTTLRAYGASDRLIEILRARFPLDNSPPSYPVSSTATPLPAARTPFSTQTTAWTPSPTTSVDYAARDQKIAALNKQIDAMDESIRVFRSKYPKMTEYISQMERTREDLRRQKWAAQGR